MSSWNRSDDDDQRDATGEQPVTTDVVEEHPRDDHWLEEGLQRRRERRTRVDVTDDDG